MPVGSGSKRPTDPPRGSVVVGEQDDNEPTGLVARVYGRNRLLFSRQQICDDLLQSLPKLHAALRSNPSRNRQTWGRTSGEASKVNTFELVGMPPTAGAADGTEVRHAVAASTKLNCHLNEVLNVLMSRKTSDEPLHGTWFETAEVLYRERCRLVGQESNGTQVLLGVQMAALRPSWKLRLTPSHLCHPEHPSTQRLCFASLTHRYAGSERAVHVMKTLPQRIHDQIVPRDYRSALRDVDHLGIAFDLATKSRDGSRRQTTQIFMHAYVAAPSLESSARSSPALETRNGRPLNRTTPELWGLRGPSIVNPESKHVLKVLTRQIGDFERVIRRRRFGFQSFYFQPSGSPQSRDSSYSQHPKTCQICLKRFSLFRREFYCQICGHFACVECAQLYQVEARVGQVRTNRVCRGCVARIDSCVFDDDDIVAALGPLVVPLRRRSEWSQAFRNDSAIDVDEVDCSFTLLDSTTERSDGLDQLHQVLMDSTLDGECGRSRYVTKASVQTQLEHYVNRILRDSQHKFQPCSLKTADLIHDYRYTFDATKTTYEGHPLSPTPSPAYEARRLHHIQASGILEPEYDHSALDLLAQMAARRLNCPVGFVSLVGENVVHAVGTYPRRSFGLQTRRTESICSHAVYVDKPFVVKNGQCDLRFAQLPVIRDHGVRFYAGFPIRAPDGSIVASLCTTDRVPHANISTAEYAVMQTLADIASQLIAPRNQVVNLPHELKVDQSLTVEAVAAKAREDTTLLVE